MRRQVRIRIEGGRRVLVGHLHRLGLGIERDPHRGIAIAAVAVAHSVDEQLLEHEVEPQAALAREGALGAEALEESADASQLGAPCKKHC